MLQCSKYVFLSLALTALSVLPSEGQDGLGIAVPGDGLRPFADPLYWPNSVDPDRLPVREIPLARRPGFVGMAPPSNIRTGLTPSMSFGGAYRSNDLQGTDSETFPALGFGVTFQEAKRQWQLIADYYGEFSGAESSDSGIANHGGFLSYNRRLSQSERLNFTGFYSNTEDLTDLPSQGFSAGATEVESTGLDFTLGKDFSVRTGVEVTVSALQEETNEDDATDATTKELHARLWHFGSTTRRTDAEFRLVRFDIGDTTEDMQAFQLTHTADLGARLAASVHVQAMKSSADGGEFFPGLGGTLTTSWRNARLKLGLERDVIAAPGVGQPILSDRAQVTLDLRMNKGLLAEITAEHQRLEILGGTRPKTTVNAIEGQLSYALNPKLWVWSRVRLSKEESDAPDRNDTQVSIGLTKNLRF